MKHALTCTRKKSSRTAMLGASLRLSPTFLPYFDSLVLWRDILYNPSDICGIHDIDMNILTWFHSVHDVYSHQIYNIL